MLPEGKDVGWVPPVIHMYLDLAGMLPGVGFVFDVANAVIYAVEGNAIDAALSALSAIPGIGDAWAAGKKAFKGASEVYESWRAARGLKALDEVTEVSDALRDAERAATVAEEATDTIRLGENAADVERTELKVASAADEGVDVSKRGGCNSFDGDTRVLMADGSSKRIEDVRLGDRVVATDPETGQRGARRVTHLIDGGGLKDMVDLEVRTSDGVETIEATDGHPFWVDEEGRWIDAGDLEVGDHLTTADGDSADVVGVRAGREVHRVFNLTVDGIHTYYVATGADYVLVHNTSPTGGESCPIRLPGEATDSARPASSPHYSVVYETNLPSSSYPGRSDGFHFSEANRQLHAAFEADPRFAADMEALYPGVVDGVAPGPKGGFSREAPTDQLTWHHEATRPGVMQLVPRDHHTAPGPVQQSLHPGGKGGMATWGGGR